jgi:hypothetical protein
MPGNAATRHPQRTKVRGRGQPAAVSSTAASRPADPEVTWPTPAASRGIALVELYALFDPDQVVTDNRFGPLDPFVVRTALTLLTRVIGLPLAAIDLAPPRFACEFPQHQIPDAVRNILGPQMPRYQAWRRIILDAQMLATRAPVERDPWDGVRRVARLTMGSRASEALRPAERHFPGSAPAELSLASAVGIEAGLRTVQRPQFRRAIRVLSDLHDHDLAVATGLLPPRFGPLPPQCRFQVHLPLPPRLATAVAKAPFAARVSAAYCWTVAVRAGLTPEAADPAPAVFLDGDLWKRLCRTDPAAHGLHLTRGTWHAYLRRLAKLLIAGGAPTPRERIVADAWAALSASIRSTGRRANVLSCMAAPAKACGLRPQDLTPAWIADRIAVLSNERHRHAFRSASMLLDAVRTEGSVPGDLLPATPTGIVRRSRQGLRPPAATQPERRKTPIERAWIDLFSAMRTAGVGEDELHPVYAVRAEAVRRGVFPRDVDHVWIERRREEGDTRRATKFACAARLFDRMRGDPALIEHLPASRIGDLDDRRRSAVVLPAQIDCDLDALLTAQGASASTKREASIAVRALAEAVAGGSAGRATQSLIQLLRSGTDGLDWGRHASRASDHEDVLRRLRDFHDLPWTPAWRRLQSAVVAAGVPMRDNPIPALLRPAEGRDPLELDLAWAREIDRSLRRAGRADLAVTFVSTIGRLDALHARGDLSRSGRLPPVVGTIREKRAAQTGPTARPVPDPITEAWTALTAAARAIGCKTDVLSMIAPRAKAEGLRPQDLTASWFAALLSTLSDQQAKATRSACYLLDDLRADPRIPDGLLPIQPTGVDRRNARRRTA